jgi:PleD family two-component response regulator
MHKYLKSQEQRVRDEGERQDKCKSNQKSNKRILVVDDEPDACLSYQLVLQNAGHV